MIELWRFLMGYFACLIVSVLNPNNGQFELQTNVITFDDKTFISWESGRFPSSEWIEAGTKSIHFKKGGTILDKTYYKQDYSVTPLSIGIVRKKVEFNFNASYELPEKEVKNVYHLVLPELCVPEEATFGNRKPQHIKKVNNRVALTWTFDQDISVNFTYKKISEKDFEQYKAKGVPITMIVSPGFKASLQNLETKLKEEGKDVLARSTAYFLQQQLR